MRGRDNRRGYVDISDAVIVTAGAAAHPVERQAALMLRREVHKRTGLAWEEAPAMPSDNRPAIVVANAQSMAPLPGGLVPSEPPAKNGSPAPEGYVLAVNTSARPAPIVCAIGNDRRGVLFAVGRLLRALELRDGKARVAADLQISTAPAYPMRGMQLGYRRLNDTLDAWDVARFAQYVRDLIIFGNNAIELIPPVSPARTGLAELDPLMPLHPWDMTIALCALLDAYDMDVWFWLPLERSATQDAERRGDSLREREALFAACQRLDHLFVPGGDPGDTPPELLMPYLEDLTEAMRRHHPRAKMWVSPQKFRGANLQHFYEYLRQRQPDWLEGVVWGPGCIDTLAETRDAIPERYPIRHYPDVTHAKVCQFPFPYWDEAWAQAYERQPIQPRPTQFAHICNLHAPLTAGAVAYSDGTGDDVNKVIFDAMLWDPTADVRQVLRDYGRYFVGPDFADGVADGLLMLEQNWAGPAATNPQVATTLAHWQAMEQRATARELGSWRFQQGLIRAYADALVQKRVQQENALLAEAYSELRRASELGAAAALARAERILSRASALTAAPELRLRTHELAGMLFQSIGMQLSIEKYGASARDRGAQLDNNDAPLTDCAWLQCQIPKVRELPSVGEQLAAIEGIVNWCDPGPRGFYDDLGNRANGADAHLVRDRTWEEDPGFLRAVQDAHFGPGFPHDWRLSWTHQAQIYRGVLRLRYEGLDPQGAYALRATYAGRGVMTLQLYLGGAKVGEPVECDGRTPLVREFEVPTAAIAEGSLDVVWESTLADDVQIAEAWLIRKG
jgi:hypothetical protein